MKKVFIVAVLIMSGWSVIAQETLATVTARGNVANTSLQIGGGYVNANTTKLFILNPLGKNFALSAGANMVHESGFHIYNWTDNPVMPLFSLSNEGNVGIGTHSPKAKLDVNGNILISNSLIPMGLMTENIGTTTPLLNMSVNFREANRVEAYLGAAFRIDPRGESLGAPLFQWIKHEPNSALEPILMNLTASGNLGLGILIPTDKLAVNGNIRAKEIKVETEHWPDYVFKKDYKLPTLEETEQHIKDNGHLPGIPSAANVKSNGIELGDMNARLLKKIEELTLYLIDLKKDNLLLNERLKKLENK